MTYAQWYDLDLDQRSRSQGPESCKITQIQSLSPSPNESLKVGNLSIFKSYLLRYLQWKLATDHWFLNYGTINKFGGVRFLIFVLVLSRDLELGRNVSGEESSVIPVWGHFVFYSLFKDVIHLKKTSYWFTQYPCGRPISTVPPSLQVALTTSATVSLNCECVIYDLHLTKFRFTTTLNVYVKDHSCGTVIIWTYIQWMQLHYLAH